MASWNVASDDFEAMQEAFGGGDAAENEQLQLTAGPLGFRSQGLELGGVLLEWNSYRQSIHFRTEFRAPFLAFSFTLQASAPTRAVGRELGAEAAAVEHPSLGPIEYVTARGTTGLRLRVREDLAREMGWEAPTDQVARVHTGHLADLAAYCRTVLSAPRGEADASREIACRHGVLARLREALPELLAPSEEPGARLERSLLARRARVAMQARSVVDHLRVGELARQLATSERTLYRACHETFGVGPHELDQLLRLHRFRALLVERGSYRGVIAEAAEEAGFAHLGRLAGMYRRHFGEAPRETVRRGV